MSTTPELAAQLAMAKQKFREACVTLDRVRAKLREVQARVRELEARVKEFEEPREQQRQR